jgi:hypothetical protein
VLKACRPSITRVSHSELFAAFFSGYFQLGFIHRPTFMHNLETDSASVNQFLLMSMLSLSARFTPSLSTRYGGPCKASDYFSAKAHAMGEPLPSPDIPL